MSISIAVQFWEKEEVYDIDFISSHQNMYKIGIQWPLNFQKINHDQTLKLFQTLKIEKISSEI